MRYLEYPNSERDKVDQRLPEAQEKGNGELLFNGYRVSVWSDEQVMTAQHCKWKLMSQNLHLKMVKMADFILNVF